MYNFWAARDADVDERHRERQYRHQRWWHLHGGGGTIARSNSIVAGNTQTSGSDEDSDGGGTFTGSGNLIGGNPMLASLGNNGGLDADDAPPPQLPCY